jgi:hypothetical protein
MAKKCRDQLTLLVPMGYQEDRTPAEPILATKLSRVEERRIGKLYVENIRLVYKCQAEMRRSYRSVDRENVNSCVDLAFIKAARVLDADKGKLSTVFYRFAHGEVRHWIRDSNWAVTAPPKVRQLGQRARKLSGYGLTFEQMCQELDCTVEQLLDALVATEGLAHETMNWELHQCPRPTPWDVLEEEPAT